MSAASQLQVDVQLASNRQDLPAVAEIEQWAGAALGSAPIGTQLCVRIVDETEGAELNETYRGRSGPTNVLSFPFAAAEHTDPPLLGDVVICAPVVAREARAQHKSTRAHFAHMVVHGVLHLLGHEHDSEAQAREMESVERAILARLDFTDPYALDAAS